MKISELARTIDAVIAGAGGVFTDNRELEGMLIDGAAIRPKWRSHYDGQGVSLLRAADIRLGIFTGESGESARYIRDMVDRWNSLPSSSKIPGDGGWMPVTLVTGVIGNAKDKAIEQFLKKIGTPFERCAGIGHDVVHAQLLKKVALPVVPADADPTIKEWIMEAGGLITERTGGNGAFRDLVNLLLKARGIDPFSLPTE